MADHTHIEWTDATWNPVTGCSVVSPGCTNCYAMKLAGTRLQHHPSRAGLTQPSKAGPVWTGEVRLNEAWLDQPLRWRRPRRIFVCAHGDLFHEDVPDAWIDQVFAVMALSPHHTFQVLTKRAARMRAYLSDPRTARRAYELVCDRAIDEELLVVLQAPGCEETDAWPNLPRIHLGRFPLPNIWLGVSAEDQTRADERIPDLLATPAAVRFVSLEPMLGPVDLDAAWHGESALTADCWGDCAWCDKGFSPRHNCLKREPAALDVERGRSGLDWVILGGESGPGARPMHPDWARQVRDACAAAGVPFFFKQWGSWSVVYDRDRDDPDWRNPPNDRKTVGRYLNLAGGHGFHGERVCFVQPVGKAAAGRLLDGVTHDAMPAPAASGSGTPKAAQPSGQHDLTARPEGDAP
ncbi:MAG: DUF5131 family protein [Pseudomonadota bacterium]